MKIKFLHAMTSCTKEELAEEKEFLQSLAAPGTEIDVDEITNGAATIESYFDIYIGAVETLKKVQQAERYGFDGVVITCFGNANLEPAREIANIPVIGSGLASVTLAATLGHKFSIIGTIPGVVNRIGMEVRKAGVYDKLASIRCVDMGVQELGNDKQATRDAMIREARRAISEDNADVIVPGCFGMIGFAAEMQEILGVPVIEPAGAAVCLMETLVRLGLSQSKKAYATPPDKPRAYGF